MRAGLLVAIGALAAHAALGGLQASGSLPADSRWIQPREIPKVWNERKALRSIAKARHEIGAWLFELSAPPPDSLQKILYTTYYSLSSSLRHAQTSSVKKALRNWDAAFASYVSASERWSKQPEFLNELKLRDSCQEADSALKDLHDRLTR